MPGCHERAVLGGLESRGPAACSGRAAGPRGGSDSRVAAGPALGVPSEQIPRLRYPTELTPERFEEEFVARNRPLIIEGLVDDWPAFQEGARCWRGRRWLEVLGTAMVECNFDPVDNRMFRFEDANPSVLLNPGRLRLPYAAFHEVGEVRKEILQLLATGQESQGGPGGSRGAAGFSAPDLSKYPDLRDRLNAMVEVQNVPIEVDPNLPFQFFAPFKCRIRDLVPLAFYMANDYHALPLELQKDVEPQHTKLLPAWGEPSMSRCWVTPGAPWRPPHPPCAEHACPLPGDDPHVYSCFHFDRMENLHSLLGGEKQVCLVAHADARVLKGTRFAAQKQWAMTPVPTSSGALGFGPMLVPCVTTECASDQSAVHPWRKPEANRLASGGLWPEAVEAPVACGHLRKGDTLYIPAHHWHFVASTAPPSLGPDQQADGAFACSVNFWWWPVHGKQEKQRWVAENEVWSRSNARIGDPRLLLAAMGPAEDIAALVAGPPVASIEAAVDFEKVD